ncbi:glycoprotein [Kupe virus]|uniref:M polyprotein n=1 Tax=Kupe virus TaxID=498356 RepID=B8PWH4_9VIRU|nr:glycoprotein [Kupe virus]ABY82501.1 glycoprotein [Kupe virus]
MRVILLLCMLSVAFANSTASSSSTAVSTYSTITTDTSTTDASTAESPTTPHTSPSTNTEGTTSTEPHTTKQLSTRTSTRSTSTSQRVWKEVAMHGEILSRNVRSSSYKDALNARILSLMDVGLGDPDKHLDNICSNRKVNCSVEALRSRLAEFFSDTHANACYNEVLERHLCDVNPQVSQRPSKVLGIDDTVLLRELDRRILRFFSDTARMTCLSASLLKPDSFVDWHEPRVIPINGPKQLPVHNVHCLNIELESQNDGNLIIVHVSLSSVDVVLKDCKATINLRQCLYMHTGTGKIRVPKFIKQDRETSGKSNKLGIGVYTITLDLLDTANLNCRLTTQCIVKGKELKKGQSEMKGYTTELVFPRASPLKRRILAVNEPSANCNSGTHLSDSKSIEVHGDHNGGPGQKITFCNGSLVLDVQLGSREGCYTVNKVTTKRVCKPRTSVAACKIEKELKNCDSGKCLQISQEGLGKIKVARGSTIVITDCRKQCLIPIPADTGDILVDCSGGKQHFLESNIVDVHCPKARYFNGIMLYFCRMSHRPIVAVTFGLWLGCGYVVTCIASFILYYLIFFLANAVKKCRQRREKPGALCLKCEQKTLNIYDQELHDLNCSFNLCPYCCNRMSDEGIVRHVGKCPKREERLFEIETYMNYIRVPVFFRCLLSISIGVGTFLKRATWLAILIILFCITIAPVQGQQLNEMANIGGQDYSICFFLFGCLVASAALLKLRRVNSGSVIEVIDCFGRCSFCGEFTDCLFEEIVHDTLCNLCVCPYCEGQSLDITTLRIHVGDCYKTNTRKQIYKILGRKFTQSLVAREGLFTTKLQIIFNKTNTILFIFAICFLILFTAHPVHGFDSGNLPKGVWEDSEDLIAFCTQTCFIEEDECICPEINPNARRLLFFNGLQNAIRRSTESKKLMTSLSIDTPWGAINVESTYKPTLATSNIGMSWSSADIRGDKVILSGKSSSIIKLNAKTGIMWELGSELASEKKNLLISIMDYTQSYNAAFEYITGDRTLSEWPKAVCTGDCPHKCGCTTTTCMFKEWPHTRNWRCNPTWCWGIGTGCTCCGMDVEKPFNRFFAVKWSLEYIKTEALMCIEVTNEERHCEIVEAGTRFTIGPVTATISDTQNIVNKLPTEIMTIQKLDDSRFVDIMHVSNVISAENSCKLQSCTHGSAGDIQIYHTDNLIKNDHSSGINLAAIDPLVNTSWLSWEGCDMDYFCNVGDWPTCTYTGVVTQNTESFENLLNIEKDYTKRFFFHTKRIMANSGTLQMDLKARPNEGGGEVTVLVEVENMELHSKTIKLAGIKISNLKCSGCYSCTSGILCSLVARIDNPDEFIIHLRSKDPDVVVADTGIVARKGISNSAGKIRVFSVAEKKKLCFEVVEGSYCKDCSRDQLNVCTDVNLEPPKDILLEHRGTIVQHKNDTCSSGIDCWSKSISSFASGVGIFFTRYFGSVVLGLLGTLLPFILVIIFFIWGDKLLKPCSIFFRCCRQRHHQHKYSSLSEEEELRDIVRKFNKSGELLEKGENDKRTIARLFMADVKGKGKKLKELA